MTSVTLPQEAAEEAVSTASFEELYAQYATDVLRVCYFYLGDRQRAEDVCQDVFVKLMTTSPELKVGKEKSWLLKVAAVNRLPADFKEVILLHYYQGYGIAEIAQMLGVAEGTVSSRLSRARDKLQKLYHGEG